MRLFKNTLWLLVLVVQLLAAEEKPPHITVSVPMRDGTMLPTDVYFPPNKESDAKLPCLLIRSPGGRQTQVGLSFLYLTQCGYAVAIQETRSSLDPDGKTWPYWTDGWDTQQDGYDAVEWLAKSSHTNGKIGTIGVSALGITQLLMAPSAPPSLKCQYIGMAAASLYHDAIFPGGPMLKNQVEGWLGYFAKDPSVFREVCEQKQYGEFWHRFDTPKVAHRVKVPGFLYAGWYDTFVQGTINAFIARQQNGGVGAKGTQKLVIGPWTHYWPTSMKLGDYEIPMLGRMPQIDISPKRWFDHYLKDADNGIDAIPAITYYVMGPFDGSPSSGNVWRTTDSWPIPATSTPFYLNADHTLNANKTDPLMKSLTYVYDPSDPITTLGGCNLFLESGPKDQREIEKRKDVLVFTTDVLPEDLEVTGRLFAKIYLTSDQPDTDVMIRLCDVYPDGHSILIADGAARTGAVETHSHHTAKALNIDLWSTSIVFAKGHRIRVSIASSNYPRFDLHTHGNPDNPPVAHNTLHLGGTLASHIILPIVQSKTEEVSE